MTDLHVLSFGYGHDVPAPEADITVDVRDWFRDPHIHPELRNMTGRDQPVIDKVTATPGVRDFVAGLYRTLSPLLYLGDRAVVVAIGCVGGRHRSVVIAELIVERARRFGWTAGVEHLHVDRPVIQRDRGSDRG